MLCDKVLHIEQHRQGPIQNRLTLVNTTKSDSGLARLPLSKYSPIGGILGFDSSTERRASGLAEMARPCWERLFY